MRLFSLTPSLIGSLYDKIFHLTNQQVALMELTIFITSENDTSNTLVNSQIILKITDTFCRCYHQSYIAHLLG